jgi:hypothetical protein
VATPNFFPRSRGGRFGLAVLSLCLLPVSAPFAVLFVWSLVALVLPGKPQPIDPWVHAFLIILSETFFAVFLVCILGLIWAVWTPAWVERIIERSARRAMLGALLMMIVGAILFAS